MSIFGVFAILSTYFRTIQSSALKMHQSKAENLSLSAQNQKPMKIGFLRLREQVKILLADNPSSHRIRGLSHTIPCLIYTNNTRTNNAKMHYNKHNEKYYTYNRRLANS